MNKNCSDRLKLVLMLASILIIIAMLTYIPPVIMYGAYECPIYKVTGLKCPGCGGTRMLKSILRFDFKQAFLFNPFLFITIPIMISRISYETIRYIRKGNVSKHFDKYMISYAIITTAFGLLRNII